MTKTKRKSRAELYRERAAIESARVAKHRKELGALIRKLRNSVPVGGVVTFPNDRNWPNYYSACSSLRWPVTGKSCHSEVTTATRPAAQRTMTHRQWLDSNQP